MADKYLYSSPVGVSTNEPKFDNTILRNLKYNICIQNKYDIMYPNYINIYIIIYFIKFNIWEFLYIVRYYFPL